jgi:hypothetical protein
MRGIMKRAAVPLLSLALSACSMIPGMNSGSSSTGYSTTDPSGATTTTATSSTATSSATTTAAATETPASTPTATTSVTFDTAKKLEYVDVYVAMGDPTGQRALVPYLMKPKDWMLIKCEMLGATSKHYTFMRVSTADGHSLPQVDIFKQGR